MYFLAVLCIIKEPRSMTDAPHCMCHGNTVIWQLTRSIGGVMRSQIRQNGHFLPQKKKKKVFVKGVRSRRSTFQGPVPLPLPSKNPGYWSEAISGKQNRNITQTLVLQMLQAIRPICLSSLTDILFCFSTLATVETPYPMLVLVGPPGAGKMELANKLTEDFPTYFGFG